MQWDYSHNEKPPLSSNSQPELWSGSDLPETGQSFVGSEGVSSTDPKTSTPGSPPISAQALASKPAIKPLLDECGQRFAMLLAHVMAEVLNGRAG
jgi:hypothetical protein